MQQSEKATNFERHNMDYVLEVLAVVTSMLFNRKFLIALRTLNHSSWQQWYKSSKKQVLLLL